MNGFREAHLLMTQSAPSLQEGRSGIEIKNVHFLHSTATSGLLSWIINANGNESMCS